LELIILYPGETIWKRKKPQKKKRAKSSFINTPTMKKIMNFVESAGQYSQKPNFDTIFYQISSNKKTVRTNIDKLEKAGLLKKNTSGGYQITGPGKRKYFAGEFVQAKSKMTMRKKFRTEVANSFRELAKGKNEYSIAIDFERRYKNPERMVLLRGGKGETQKVSDFEMFGHTHPDRALARPSHVDLQGISKGNPEFIVAGKKAWNESTNQIMILQLKDQRKYNEWSTKMRFDGTKKQQKEQEDRFYSEDLWRSNFARKKDRDIFLEKTGIDIRPYKNNMMLEMQNDPIKEKRVPTINYGRLTRWQRNTKKKPRKKSKSKTKKPVKKKKGKVKKKSKRKK